MAKAFLIQFLRSNTHNAIFSTARNAMDAPLPSVSIITIVYNDVANIISTIDSVLAQDYPYLQYIIIDGASTDGSTNAIKQRLEQYALHIQNKASPNTQQASSTTPPNSSLLTSSATSNSPYTPSSTPSTPPYSSMTHISPFPIDIIFLSEQDDGIYDAMNKGIARATGAWCNFMNSGDRFYSSHAISDMMTSWHIFIHHSTNTHAFSSAHNQSRATSSSSATYSPPIHTSLRARTFAPPPHTYPKPPSLPHISPPHAHLSPPPKYLPHPSQTQPKSPPSPHIPKDSFIIYGDTHILYDSIHSKILRASTRPHTYHHHFIHQSAFITTPLLRHFYYDKKFRIAGDTDFFTKSYHHGALFYYIPIIIASFNVEGISSSLSWRMFYEDCLIGYRYHRLFPILHALRYVFIIIPRVFVRSLIPKAFRNQARIMLSKRTS